MNIMNQGFVTVLIGYVKGLISLDQLKEWLAENVGEMSSSVSPLDRMMSGELELALAEYDRGDRDETYVRRHIQGLLLLPNPALVPQLKELSFQ